MNMHFIPSRLLRHLLATSAGLIAFTSPVLAVNFQYVAVTDAAMSARQGAVVAGSLTWQCKNNRCTISGPWPKPAVSACMDLAKQVGWLRSYGHSAAMLSTVDLAKCNAAVPALTQRMPATIKPAAPTPGALGMTPSVNTPAKNKPGEPPALSNMPGPGTIMTTPTMQSPHAGSVTPGATGFAKPTVKLPKLKAVAPEASVATPLPNNFTTPLPPPAPPVAAAPSAPAHPVAIMERNFAAGTFLDTRYSRWSCEGNRCTTMRMLNVDTVECQALAQAAGRLVSFATPTKQFDANDMVKCNSPVVSQIEVYACSGDDDLRRNSHLNLALIIGHRGFDAHTGYQLFTGIPGNTCKTATYGPPVLGKFALSDLSVLSFKFTSGQPTSFRIDSPDNWDMSQLTVQAMVTDPGGRQSIIRLLDKHDKKRFSDGDMFQVEMNYR